MTTYFFVTKRDYNPENVNSSNVVRWSCSSKTKTGDYALVYVAKVGVQFEWRVVSDAQRDKKWTYVCEVEHVRTFDPPIPLREIRAAITNDEWAPPYKNFRGVSSITVPDSIAERIRSLHSSFVGADNAYFFAEEVPALSGLMEGAVRKITVNAYERNPEARRHCIEHHGRACCVCGIDFGAVYGPVAEGFIHTHHLRPLSKIGAKYKVDPVADLRPVCPNCHAVIHLGGQVRSIQEVRELFTTPRQSNSKLASRKTGQTGKRRRGSS